MVIIYNDNEKVLAIKNRSKEEKSRYSNSMCKIAREEKTWNIQQMEEGQDGQSIMGVGWCWRDKKVEGSATRRLYMC